MKTSTTTNKKGLVYNRTTPVKSSSLEPKIAKFFGAVTQHLASDNLYRKDMLSLTASENYQSFLVRMLSSSHNSSFYSFIPPYNVESGEWFFPDSDSRKEITALVREIGKALFHSLTFDERPNGGSGAEQAVLLATCNRGDGWLHFSAQDGGHFGNEAFSTKVALEEHFFPVDPTTGLIKIEELNTILKKHQNIKLLLLDQSHKLRYQPLAEIKKLLQPDVLLAYDCSHDMGLILGGSLPQPLLEGADVLIGNTHKTFPSVNKAIIAFADKNHPLFKPVSDWVCPFLQSNSHHELTLPLLISLMEMKVFAKDYAEQTVKNAKAFAKELREQGFNVSGEHFGYTETHQVHVILDSRQDALKSVSELLPDAGIRANNIMIPGHNNAFGLRLGTQAITRRGMKEEEMREVAKFLAKVLLKKENPTKIKAEVKELLMDFPLFPLPYSFDFLVDDDLGKSLLMEVLSK
jgi:glycine hydroxymethyltransferase